VQIISYHLIIWVKTTLGDLEVLRKVLEEGIERREVKELKVRLEEPSPLFLRR